MKARRSRSEWIIAGLILLVLFLVSWVASAEKGLAAGATIGVFATIIQTKYESRRETLNDWRFWLIIGVLIILHFVLIFTIEFPKLQAGLICLPVALVDGFIIWAFINWVERRFFIFTDDPDSS